MLQRSRSPWGIELQNNGRKIIIKRKMQRKKGELNMDKREYEERIRELENQFKVMKERYQILEETTTALLFEYKPQEDVMIFNYNFPDNKSRKVIEHYHEYMKVSPLVHPDHLPKFLSVLGKASQVPVRGELEYLSRVSGGEFQWHKTYYSSIAGKDGKVISVLGRIHNIHELKTEAQQMIHRVETDFLTGLYNKGAVTEKIAKWMKENPTREAHMIMVDLDDFKNINDGYGHAFGDEILKETAHIIEESFGDNGICSRFGGDEFVIFVMDEPVRNVECRVDEMMRRFSEEVTSMEQPLRCSVGVSSRVSKWDEFEDLFNRADNAMYLAKHKGKNRYYVDKQI